MIDLPVLRVHPETPLPAGAYAGDAGLDLVSRENVSIGPGERAIVGTGIAVAVPAGHAGLVVPRSGLAAASGISIVNAPGLIDSGYRGEVKVILLNTDAHATFVVEEGMRIAQLVLVATPAVTLVDSQSLPESERGSGGFGSSGVR